MLEQLGVGNDVLVHTFSITLFPSGIEGIVFGAVFDIPLPIYIRGKLHHILQVPWNLSGSVNCPTVSFLSQGSLGGGRSFIEVLESCNNPSS